MHNKIVLRFYETPASKFAGSYKRKAKKPENRACPVRSESHLTGIDPV